MTAYRKSLRFSFLIRTNFLKPNSYIWGKRKLKIKLGAELGFFQRSHIIFSILKL